MSVPLYMDVHVHRALTDGLRSRGADVLTAQEDGADQWEDPDLLSRATAMKRVLFTNDRDFLSIATARQQTGTPFAGVIYAPQTSPIGRVLHGLELCVFACEPEEFAGSITFLPFS